MSGDGFQPHAAVDGLGGQGGQGVPQRVAGAPREPGGAGDAGNDAADGVPVQRAAVVGDQPLVAGKGNRCLRAQIG